MSVSAPTAAPGLPEDFLAAFDEKQFVGRLQALRREKQAAEHAKQDAEDALAALHAATTTAQALAAAKAELEQATEAARVAQTEAEAKSARLDEILADVNSIAAASAEELPALSARLDAKRRIDA